MYTDKLSKLAVRCDQKSNGNVMQRIRRIFSRAFVDEVQDMSGYDLDFIRLLMKSGVCVTMVGDPRQTTYSTHNEKRYERYKGGRIQDFIKDKCNDLCEIDTSSFAINYRCNDAICHLANQLFPKYPPSRSGQKEVTGYDGVFSIKPDEVPQYLAEYRPVQLRHSSRTHVNHEFPYMTFGHAKGLTFDRVLIYPTGDFVKWLRNRKASLQPETRCKLYVALTRAKYSVAIVLDLSDQTRIEGVERFSFKKKLPSQVTVSLIQCLERGKPRRARPEPL